MPSSWFVEFAFGPVNSHAWGTSIGEEFAAKDALLCLLSHKKGSVYLALLPEGSHGPFLLDFGQYWQASTYKRWGTFLITYRSGPTGLFLDFPGPLVLQDFEDCCDRLLSRYRPGAPALTPKVLQDLGIGSLVDGILVRAADYAHLTRSRESTSSSDEETASGSSVYSADHVDEEVLNIVTHELDSLHMPA